MFFVVGLVFDEMAVSFFRLDPQKWLKSPFCWAGLVLFCWAVSFLGNPHKLASVVLVLLPPFSKRALPRLAQAAWTPILPLD